MFTRLVSRMTDYWKPSSCKLMICKGTSWTSKFIQDHWQKYFTYRNKEIHILWVHPTICRKSFIFFNIWIFLLKPIVWISLFKYRINGHLKLLIFESLSFLSKVVYLHTFHDFTWAILFNLSLLRQQQQGSDGKSL